MGSTRIGPGFEERTVASTTVHQGRILAVSVDRVELPDGRLAEREVVRHPGATAIVAVDGEMRVIMVEQYRYAVGCTLLEIPAGKIDGAEDPLLCAKRELAEEAGLEAAEWSLLGSLFTSPGFSNEVIHVFLARGLAPAGAGFHRDEDELIASRAVPLKEALSMIDSGVIRDAKSVAGLLLASQKTGLSVLRP